VLLWNLKFFRPEPLPNWAQHPVENTEDEDKSLNNFFMFLKIQLLQHLVEKTSTRAEAQ
jgi:hypothetical protein